MNKYNFSRKAIALLLGGTMSVSLSACKDDNKDGEVIQETTTTASTSVKLISDSNFVNQEIKNEIYDVHGHKLEFIPINEDNRSDQTYKVSYTTTSIYVTKSDETLKSISINCDVNISQILNMNDHLGIDYSVVNFEDQILQNNTLLRMEHVKEYPYIITEVEKGKFFSDFCYYNVEDGDCLLSIARESDVPDKIIRVLNDLDSDMIYPKQNLLLPVTEYSKAYQKIN
ncbi:MAG: LysM peptidoglycan-binding domain-containing protein [Bacilli bacterium]|nr:LysM peptidoglycan-binding domain-containing protein [Bacilli bacterium]